MVLLLDAQILLWVAGRPEKLSEQGRSMIAETRNELWFSAASLWEITIKHGLGHPDFRVDPHLLRRGLLANGYTELPVTRRHGVATAHLPAIHGRPLRSHAGRPGRV